MTRTAHILWLTPVDLCQQTQYVAFGACQLLRGGLFMRPPTRAQV